MPTYETLFITPPDLTDEQEKATVESLAQVITDGGGTFTANERMGRRRLAYPIRKFDEGVYVRFLYDAAIAVPRELERRIRLSENVLRSLTVKLEKEWAAAAKDDAVRAAQRREEAARAAAEAEAQAAADAEVLPVDAHATARAPPSIAFDTAMVMPRSLNDPVGLAPSNFR